MKIAIGFTLGISLGFVLGFITHLMSFRPPTTEDHWNVVNGHNIYVRNPANYKPVPGTGLSAATLPVNPVPSLAALVAAGELIHLDLVFPRIPRSSEARRYCLRFCTDHSEIVYFEDDSIRAVLNPTGTQPLHFNIWFREGDSEVVQTLIRELEENFAVE